MYYEKLLLLVVFFCCCFIYSSVICVVKCKIGMGGRAGESLVCVVFY